MFDFEIINPKITEKFLENFYKLERQAYKSPNFPNTGYHTEIEPDQEVTEHILTAPDDIYATRAIVSNYKGGSFVSGYVIVDLQDTEEAVIYDLAVNKDDKYRNKKGTRLIEKAEQIALKGHFNSLSITTHKDSHIAKMKKLAVMDFKKTSEDKEKNTITFKKELHPRRRF